MKLLNTEVIEQTISQAAVELTACQIRVISTLLIVSFCCFLIPAFDLIIRWFDKHRNRINRKTRMNYLLVLSICLIPSVWCMRYAVGYYNMIIENDNVFNWFEEILNSIIHALQTFSMDEDYNTYIHLGKQMIRALPYGNSSLVCIYGVYASVMNVAAPLAGGAIILEVLASIFPKFRLFWANFHFWKEKYYFSELNECSLALGKSIAAQKASVFKRPVLIYTDAYIDDEEEKSSEIYLEAKRIGAICVKEDLSHVKKSTYAKKKFFLIDDDESDNLRTLASVAASSGSNKYLKQAEIYLFTNTNAYLNVEQNLKNKLLNSPGFNEENLPILIPIKSYRNLITDMLVREVPLFDPLIGKERGESGKVTLTVTIIGIGAIGREMFLSAYWLGQILDCNLKINIISKENESVFWSKIDYINPEIRRTTRKSDPILRINRKGDMADVYCDVRYIQCDAKSSQLISLLTDKENPSILNTDYFLVALGTDRENISVADTLRKYIGEYHISLNKRLKTVIAYVVYNSELSDVLNRQKLTSFVGDEADVYMSAIGCLEDVFSVRNVFFEDNDQMALEADNTYNSIHARAVREERHRARIKDDYSYWASLASSMHQKYKAYSMRLITASVFDYPDTAEGRAEYEIKMQKEFQNFERIASGDIEFENEEQAQEHLELLHRLAWLEHRRWAAFTRVMGFRHTSDYKNYYKKTNSHKQMDIRLHPCLVECDQKGIKTQAGYISCKGKIDSAALFKRAKNDREDFDFLDELSYELHEEDNSKTDFKFNDYNMITRKPEKGEDEKCTFRNRLTQAVLNYRSRFLNSLKR